MTDLARSDRLAPMDVAGRLDRLRAGLVEAGCDALLVTKLVNIRYLSGFTGSAALLLVGSDELLFVSDGRYGEQAAEQLAAAGVDARIEISGTEQRRIVSAAAAGVARLGLEADHVTWAAQRRYAGEWFAEIDLVATEGLVEGLRLVKDDGEIARITAAAAVADEALGRVRPRLADGPTEAEFALELDTEIRRIGAEGNSFETIGASGPNGAKPHHRPGRRRIASGDLVVIDFGALVDGYCSDMTRTVMVGEPTVAQRRMLDVVAASQAAGVAAVSGGVACREVDRTCREVITEAGWGEAFVHGTGHGVGLEIHEAPRVAQTSTATLAAGHVVTVEPGVYLPEHGGVRVEDTVVVVEHGCRALTGAPKDPILQ
ncbi:MAG: aminopeptidase P family protein [Acidimicrobiales bacterium]